MFDAFGNFRAIFRIDIIRRIAGKLCTASFWTSNFSISVLENTQTPHFHDFGISGRVHDSQNELFSSSETPGTFNNSEENPKRFSKNVMLGNHKCSEIEIVEFLRRRTLINAEDPSNKLFDILNM